MNDQPSSTAVQRVIVAVPVNNEERHLEGCLTAIEAARSHLGTTHPEVEVVISVSLDSCTDASPMIAARFAVQITHHTARSVGATRDHAIRAAVAAASEHPSHPPAAPHAVWVACTDADTQVPPHWLTAHVDLAAAGYDLVLGTVQPNRELAPAAQALWHRAHTLAENHPHIHGANLGVRLSAWRHAGGFGQRSTDEDVHLAHTIKTAGRPWIASDTFRVTTSGRLAGRAPRGFADYLTTMLTAQPTHPMAAAP